MFFHVSQVSGRLTCYLVTHREIPFFFSSSLRPLPFVSRGRREIRIAQVNVRACAVQFSKGEGYKVGAHLSLWLRPDTGDIPPFASLLPLYVS